MVLTVGAGRVHFGASGLLGKLNSRSNLLPRQSSQIEVVLLNWEGRLPNLTTLCSLSASIAVKVPDGTLFEALRFGNAAILSAMLQYLVHS